MANSLQRPAYKTGRYDVGDLMVVRDGADWVVGDVLACKPTLIAFDGRKVIVPELTGYVIRLADLDTRSRPLFAGRRFPTIAEARAFFRPFQKLPLRRVGR